MIYKNIRIPANTVKCWMAIGFPIYAIGFSFAISMALGYDIGDHYQRLSENSSLFAKYMIQVIFGVFALILWAVLILPKCLKSVNNRSDILSIDDKGLYIYGEKMSERSDIFSARLVLSFLSEKIEFTTKFKICIVEVSYASYRSRDIISMIGDIGISVKD